MKRLNTAMITAAIAAVTSVAVPVKIQKADLHAIDLVSGSGEVSEVEVHSLQTDVNLLFGVDSAIASDTFSGMESFGSAAPVVVTLTQIDSPLSQTGGNGFGSFLGLGAAPAGPSATVTGFRVPDGGTTGTLLLGSMALGMAFRRRKSGASQGAV